MLLINQGLVAWPISQMVCHKCPMQLDAFGNLQRCRIAKSAVAHMHGDAFEAIQIVVDCLAVFQRLLAVEPIPRLQA